MFGAWLNHDDSRGVNSLDMLQTDGARRYVKHYMFDFGSIMGSGTVFAQRHRAGNEYIVEWAPGWLTLATLGLYTRDWLHIDYPDVPASVGRFEGAVVRSGEMASRIPEHRVRQHARRRCVLGGAESCRSSATPTSAPSSSKARYSDPRATDYITATLIERRNRVLKTWLTGVNPLVDFVLSADGVLTFANAAVAAGVATPAVKYERALAPIRQRDWFNVGDDRVHDDRHARGRSAAGTRGR